MGACLSRSADGMASRKAEVYVEPEDTLEHISEREDHADHEIQLLHNVLPTSAATSPVPRRLNGTKSPQRRLSVAQLDEEGSLANAKKFNSTSTLFVDSTVSSPDLDETLRCVALAVHYIIKDGHSRDDPQLYPSRFDEKRNPLTDARIPDDYATRIPAEDEIYVFMNRLFHAAALCAECAIITLVYINRCLTYTDLTVQSSNWKRVLLGAILMATKVWDDQAVWNVDFCSILPKIDVDDMNELERTYLEMLQFNINVDSSVYAKYYFELRALAEKSEKQFPLKPLSKEAAAKLEAMSSLKMPVENMRPAKSLDGEIFKARAIIS